MSETIDTPLLPEFAGFFEHVREGRLAFPKCRDCGRFHWYPMPRCPHCRSRDIAWQVIAGPAEIWSFTRVTHPFDPTRAGALPYVVALVTFADAPGVRLVTNIEGDPAVFDGLHIGQTVTPVFGLDRSGQPVVTFRPE